jgi:hypothetical protein
MTSSLFGPCRLKTLRRQYALDGVSAERVAEVIEGALDSRVATTRILLRHANDERSKRRLGARPSRSAAAAVVLLRDELPVPTQERVRAHDGGDLHQRAPTDHVAQPREAPTLCLREAKAATAETLA